MKSRMRRASIRRDAEVSSWLTVPESGGTVQVPASAPLEPIGMDQHRLDGLYVPAIDDDVPKDEEVTVRERALRAFPALAELEIHARVADDHAGAKRDIERSRPGPEPSSTRPPSR